jgi:type I restriction enzyme M protein
VCLWFLDRAKATQKSRERASEVLFIDARQFGARISRTQIELAAHEIARITSTYHAWRGQPSDAIYEDQPGFCRAVSLAEVEAARFVLTPGRYVGSPDEEEPLLAEDLDQMRQQILDDFAKAEVLTARVIDAMGAVAGLRPETIDGSR